VIPEARAKFRRALQGSDSYADLRVGAEPLFFEAACAYNRQASICFCRPGTAVPGNLRLTTRKYKIQVVEWPVNDYVRL
jgi:hypothetical protein